MRRCDLPDLRRERPEPSGPHSSGDSRYKNVGLELSALRRRRVYFLRKTVSPILLKAVFALAFVSLAAANLEGQLFQKPKPAETPSQTTPPPATSAPAAASPADLAIPLPQIADKAEALDAVIQAISDQLNQTRGQLPIEAALKAQEEEVSDRISQVNTLLSNSPNALEIRDEELYWSALSQQFATDRKNLTARAAMLEDQIQTLTREQERWQATFDQIHDTRGIEAVLDRVRQKLDLIRVTRKWAKEQLGAVLNIQNSVSQQDKKISDVLGRLSQAQNQLRGRLLERDSHPLWRAREIRRTDQPITMLIHRSLDRKWLSLQGFVLDKKLRVTGVIVLFLLGLLAAFKLKRYASDPTRPGVTPEAVTVFSRPFSIALLVAMLGMIGHVPSLPSDVTFVVYLLCLILALRLLPPLLEPGLRPFLYALAGINLFEGLRLLIPISPVLRREISAVTVLGAISLFVWLIRPAYLQQLGLSGRTRQILVIAVRTGITLLAISLLANVFGFVSLAIAFAVATLLGAFVAAAFYSMARILNLIFVVALRSDKGRDLTQQYREPLERWGKRVLDLGALALWLRFELYLFTVLDDLTKGVLAVLNYSFKVGGEDGMSFSLGGALSVFLIVIIGYGLAKLITFLLQNVVLAKLPLHYGLPYAISKVSYYVLLIVVFVAALADTGVRWNKFTVITGALGVGLGFGLQNIVNNFVSGLILLFERPIRVGDVVDIGGLVGSVKRIGARSSTVQTPQDAEVIVPNSTLISNQVINWTLSSAWRRVEVPVGVAYGTDPELVLKLLVDVARSNSMVMINPPPMAFFLGFGESSLNFELRFWSARQETWFQLKSDICIAIAKTFREAGIEIPFPQRELRVRALQPLVGEKVPAKGASSQESDPPGDSAQMPSAWPDPVFKNTKPEKS
ncbi:MAG: mechanosensitive ion channel [Terriglobia bacterium]